MKPGGGGIRSAISISPAIGFKRSAISAGQSFRQGPGGPAENQSPRIRPRRADPPAAGIHRPAFFAGRQGGRDDHASPRRSARAANLPGSQSGQPRIIRGHLGELPAGRISAPRVVDPVLPGEPSASFLVKVSEAEFERTQMDAAGLQAAAAKTKGHFYRFDTAGRLLDDLPSGRHVPMKPTSPADRSLEQMARLVASG